MGDSSELPGAVLEAIIEAAPTAMLVVDAEGRIVVANADASSLFGYTAAQFGELHVDDLVPTGIRGEHAELRQSYHRHPHKRTMGTYDNSVRALCADGRQLPVEVGLNPVATDHGQFVVVTVMDASRTAEQLALYARNLEDRQRALEQSNNELERFAMAAAHDLKAPLRQMASFAELLAKRYAASLDEAAAEFIDYIIRGASDLQLLVTDLLRLARLGARPKSMMPIDLRSLAEGVVKRVALTIEERKGVVEIGELPRITGDPSSLALVFQNLIANALHYNESDPPVVSLSAEPFETGFKLVVADNGIGVKPADHERIFEAFTRAVDPGIYPGTGIGLAMCRRIVANHGGDVWVEPNDGGGSRFCFTLGSPPS